MSEPRKEEAAVELSGDDLGETAAQLKALVEIKDRAYGFPARNYERCFVGSDAVVAMVARGMAADAADAVRIGNLLLGAGVFRHVLGEHPFRNEALFYRFADDGGHGATARRPDGAAVSWSDFIAPPVADDAGQNLQPALPPRDARLASFAQDELDAIGVAPLDEHNVTLLDHVHPRQWVDPLPKPRYNLVVIGAGAGGLVSAAGAAGVGAQVALVESHLLGGDCLNVGCVPSKALLRCAHAAAAARNAAAYGVKVGSVEVDFAAVMERMRRLRAQIAPNDSAHRFAQTLGIDVFFGRARFTGSDRIEVNGRTLNFAKAIIATGATAAIPPIPGLVEAGYLTNATVFNLTQRPERLAVIGAGPIGMELAQAFQRLGSQATVLCRGQVLGKEDADAARIVQASMRRDGVTFCSVDEYLRVEGGNGRPVRLVLRCEGVEKTVEADHILVAAGRKPAVHGLGLEAAGVAFDERSGVQVDDRLQTRNPAIYAVGDVASSYQFTHMADFMARLAIRNALFRGRDRVSQLLVPWATFTDPEVAHVGLYERDLVERKIGYDTYSRHLAEVDRSILEGEDEGFVKIHVQKGSDKILGATIVAPHAGDMIGEIAVAISAGMGLSRLASVIHPYPTVAEAIRQCGDAFNRGRLTPTVRKLFNRWMALQR
ncbi:MAG: FAD-containing oxidoreductase [Rubrivivax sp.]|nr:FAD-containing oxidoreductase [Rubrivivax sp.]